MVGLGIFGGAPIFNEQVPKTLSLGPDMLVAHPG